MIFVYASWIDAINKRLSGWSSTTTLYGILEDNSSTYSPNHEHLTVQQAMTAGFVEVSASGYVRGRVPSKETDIVDNELQLLGGTLNFGIIESGKTIKGMMIAAQLGSSINLQIDTPVLYVNGGDFPITADGRQVFVSFTDNIFIKFICSTTPAP